MTAKALQDARVTVVNRITHPDLKSWPAVTVEVENYWEIFASDPVAVVNAKFIAKKGRKVNVHLRVVADLAHLALADFGDDLGLRCQIAACQPEEALRNLVAIGGLAGLDPKDIPGLYHFPPGGGQ